MSEGSLAPIAVFAYRRTDHLTKTLDALERCAEFSRSPVFVFSDGAKSESGAADVAAVRALVRARLRPNMTLVEAPANRGLANSISQAVTQLCDRYGRVIVIEDDLVVSPHALAWLNGGLDRYRDDERVFQISAHQFDVPDFAARKEGLFLHLTTSWGWATWKRAWDRFDPNAEGWEKLKTDRALRQRFDVGGQPYSEMLRRQMEGRLDSWAIRWWWSVFKADGICLFPPRSLVQNIGFDETATHYKLGRLRRIGPKSPDANDLAMPDLPENALVASSDEAALYAALATRGGRRLWQAIVRLINLIGR
ncbi:hypothetical protein SAMN02745172_03524 [Pseudoxanthobacter soli DSM 19599]|uniref:Glycosyl transferase family 2 n=1 Tax=Pseudoxanthobacter soli DSM 19599 TaxID=1123029 RepID=A0A1M7ZPN1_9HYPH|nr:hypothetical protein [Pseudoxanthobacter soli]SHO66864.1 hypothetical protein SAMN02745172_03524 [Pseudoxanthobacter soli DSM 19599]